MPDGAEFLRAPEEPDRNGRRNAGGLERHWSSTLDGRRQGQTPAVHWLLVALTVGLFSLLVPTTHASAQTASTTTTTVAMSDDSSVGQTKSIIPKPNSGSAPVNSGDRGGSAQLGLFGLLVIAIATIVTVVVRSTIRNGRLRDAAVQKGNSPRAP